MKLLFFQWNAFMQNDVEKILLSRPDLDVDMVSYEFRNLDEDDYFLSHFPEYLLKDKYDMVFSLNFFPLVSDLCDKYNIPYVSWVYDAPMNVRRVSSFANSVNRIYVFDGGQYNDLRRQGYTTVYHKPLGVDTNKINSMPITDQDIAKFGCDISFVGKLYSSEFNTIVALLPLDEQTRLNNLVNEQLATYGEYFLDRELDNQYIEKLNYLFNNKIIVNKQELEFLLANEVTHRERITALNLLSARHPVTLFSYNNDTSLSNVENRGAVNYYKEMPKVFKLSKINLNITLKIIKEGMPLRILDILGAGGFLLSNYQKELADNFTDGKDIAMYRSMSELVEKADYYLNNEKERRELAINGRQTAHRLFELDKLLSEIIIP